ncbi:rCG40924 [Rattus norvegicus]|uniref:RCG40924 n=1 Tax=Rattus norvegicus TaxID=10116 RepID=A6KKV7_RAT|nr:rCG40924 [Rattus norvegicus]
MMTQRSRKMESDHGACWPMTGRGAEVKKDAERSWRGGHWQRDIKTGLHQTHLQRVQAITSGSHRQTSKHQRKKNLTLERMPGGSCLSPCL